MKGPYFFGVDVGTQGARIVLLDVTGEVVAHAEETFELSQASREEQSPDGWWAACCHGIRQITSKIKGIIPEDAIQGIAVTSTSGTVIPLDAAHQPLHDAIMYSDQRSVKQAQQCKEAALKHHPDGYTGFNTSSGLSKMVWYAEEFPGQAEKIALWCHAADYITGKLSGVWGVTDHTNALKSGYDVDKELWPSYVFEALPLRKKCMPQVLPSGTVIGKLDKRVAETLGLSPNIKVAVGITDGCASQIASGAIKLGDWNTTIGTTLVIKGVTQNQLVDPLGRLYSHRHPMGYWMPGGAGNIGADWVSQDFAGQLDQLNEKAKQLIPSPYISYPLRQRGERFPFIAPNAEGFEPAGLSPEERFTANMEGVAFVEKYAYDMIGRLSGEEISAVYTAGGASNSEVWVKIRSNVLNLPIYKMKHTSGAVGAAILAASQVHFENLAEAGKSLNQIDRTVYPEEKLSAEYSSKYEGFLKIMTKKEYIQGGGDA